MNIFVQSSRTCTYVSCFTMFSKDHNFFQNKKSIITHINIYGIRKTVLINCHEHKYCSILTFLFVFVKKGDF